MTMTEVGTWSVHVPSASMATKARGRFVQMEDISAN